MEKRIPIFKLSKSNFCVLGVAGQNFFCSAGNLETQRRCRFFKGMFASFYCFYNQGVNRQITDFCFSHDARIDYCDN